MKTFLPALALAFAIGCTTAQVRPYVGKQQAWPTAVGSIVNTSYQLPVFSSLPPSPYYVLAELRVNSPLYATPEEQHLPCLVRKAASIGADAIVLVDGQLYFSVSFGGQDTNDTTNAGGTSNLTAVNKFNPDFFKQGVTAVAIKWKGNPPAGLFRNAVSGAAIVGEEVVVEATPPAPAPAPEPPKPEEAKPEAPKPTPPPVIPSTEKPTTETPAPTPAPEPPKSEEVKPEAAKPTPPPVIPTSEKPAPAEQPKTEQAK